MNFKIQEKNLNFFRQSKIKWLNVLNFRSKLPSIIYSNEFFDCFPVRQFLNDNNHWFERYVKFNEKENKYYSINKRVISKKILDYLNKYKRQKIYEVSLSINSKAEKKDFKVFELELVYAGIFTLPNINLNDEQEKRKILIEAPQLLFPFARSIVSNVTRDGGFMPLIIQPIDFELLYHSRKIEKKV